MNSPLPPLPPVPGVDESDALPGGRGMLETLTDEHRDIEDLYARLAAAVDERDMASLTSVLTATLTRHLSAEEQYLFPAVASALPDGAHQAALAALNGEVDRQATTIAFDRIFLLAGILFLIVIPLLFFLKTDREPGKKAELHVE